MRDLQVEEWFKDHGYTFKYVADFPIAEIDVAKARDNPVRLDQPLNQDIALSYGVVMESHGGTGKFPALVLLDRVGEKLKTVLGGTHRIIGALSAGFLTFDAYLIREADPARIDFVHGALNSLEGLGETMSGRLQRLFFMRENHPSAMKLTALAREYGLRQQTVSDYMKAHTAEKRADRLGVGVFFKSARIAIKTKGAFDGLQSDAVFIAAVNLMREHPDLRGGAGASLVKELKGIGSEIRAKALLLDRGRELAKIEADRKTKKVKTSSHKATKFLGRFHGVNRAWPGAVEKLFLAGIETESAKKRELAAVDRTIDIAMEVREDLKRLIEEDRKAAEWNRQVRRGDEPSEPISPTH